MNKIYFLFYKGLKIWKKEVKKVIGFLADGFLIATIISTFTFSWAHRPIKYNEAIINYGIRGNQAYCTIEAKPGYKLYVSGESINNNLNVKILSVRKISASQDSQIGWEDEIGTEENPCR